MIDNPPDNKNTLCTQKIVCYLFFGLSLLSLLFYPYTEVSHLLLFLGLLGISCIGFIGFRYRVNTQSKNIRPADYIIPFIAASLYLSFAVYGLISGNLIIFTRANHLVISKSDEPIFFYLMIINLCAFVFLFLYAAISAFYLKYLKPNV